MANKKRKGEFDFDREAKRVFKSNAKTEAKSKRHHSKEWLNNFINGSVDEEEMYDIMGEIDDTEWS